MRASGWSFRTFVFGLGLSTTGVLGCSASAPADGGATEQRGKDAREEIVGGTPTSAFAAAGALTLNGGPWCTGTLIGPRKVLTAAHCLEDGPASAYGFAIGPSVTEAQTKIAVEWITLHEKYDPETVINDIGLVTLAEDAPVAPMKMLQAMDDSWVGEELTFIGYGRTGGKISDSGVKRIGVMPIEEVWETQFRFKATDTNVCYGDSGGPAFAKRGDGYLLAGVSSRTGNEDCENFGIDTRVDVYLDNFIAYGGPPDDYDPSTGTVGGGGSGGGGGTTSELDPCQGETFEGRCDGDTVIWCENESITIQDCSADGNVCGFSSANNYYGCLPPSAPTDNCQGETYEGRCDGDTVIWCENDEVKTLSCTTCGYDSASGMYNCL